MARKTDKPVHTSAVQNILIHEGRTYESRLVLCGKTNCTRCFPPGQIPRPSHGPYWYLCGTRNGKWSRLYLGRQLDTTRFVAPDGSIDWSHAKSPHSVPGRPPHLSHIVPGQLDAVDEATLTTTPTDHSTSAHATRDTTTPALPQPLDVRGPFWHATKEDPTP